MPAKPARAFKDAPDIPRIGGAGADPAGIKPGRPQPVVRPTAADRLATAIAEGKGAEPARTEPAKTGDAKIVSIDAFRRKP